MSASRILFFAGSSREGSFNKQLARCGKQLAEENGQSATFADLADYPMPLYNGDLEARDGIPDEARAFETVMRDHNAVVVVAPEYNASITPLLKNTLDWVSRLRQEKPNEKTVFQTRLFALAAASPGGTGGIRGLFTVRHVLQYGLSAQVMPEQFLLPKAGQAFDSDGRLKDADAEKRFAELINALSDAANRLHGV